LTDTPPIITTPDDVSALVGTLDGREMYLGLKFVCPEPLGTIEIRLVHQAARSIAAELTRLLNLDAAQRAALLEYMLAQPEHDHIEGRNEE